MREFMTFLTAVIILAIAQTLTTALWIVLLIFALMGFVAFPRRTFQLIASLGLLVLALEEPAYCVGAMALIGVTVAATGRALQWRASRSVPRAVALLPAPRRD